MFDFISLSLPGTGHDLQSGNRVPSTGRFLRHGGQFAGRHLQTVCQDTAPSRT